MRGICSLEDCGRPHLARGLCRLHYNRWWMHGDPSVCLLPHSRKREVPLADRVLDRVERRSDGCWIWTGAQRSDGYGHVKNGGKVASVHRVVYEALVGSIPEGLVLDHLCRVKKCVNPAHLEPVTSAENTRRGLSPSAVNARKTHCKRGHEFTPENTEWLPRGRRACRACKQARSVLADQGPS